ncbi:hypothetical protein JCM6882_008944 [Rhodosporidiobolus microsporus]
MNRLKQSLSSLPTPALPSFASNASDDADRPTPPPLPVERLEQLTTRRTIAKGVQATVEVFHKTLSKQRPDPRTGGTATASPARWVGEAMRDGAEELERTGGGDAALEAYGQALSSVGELHLRLADLSTEYTDALSLNILTSLETRADDHKQLKEAVKETEKKRAALETVMAKAEKSKKDPSELEDELEQASSVYENECDFLARKADSLDAGIVRDVEDLKQLVEDQLAFALRYVELLEECKATLPSTSSLPTTRARSSSLQVPTVATRMSRSQSDSSVRGLPIPSSSSGLFSSLGPNRSRRSTVSSQTSEKDKSKDNGDGTSSSNSAKNRSRSGSMLERFALGNKGKKKDASSPSTPNEEGNEREEREPGSPTASGTSTPSRFNPSLNMPTIPGLPTFGSLKKLAATPGGRYGSLDDEPDRAPSSPSYSSSSRPSSAASSSRPPLFKRTQTAPAASSSTPSPSSSAGNSSPRRAVPPPPLAPPRNGPVGKTYRAQWAYSPRAAVPVDDDDDDDEELTLEQGDVVRVEKEVNSDWWVGVKVGGTGGRRAQRGMFPSAYVVACEDPEEAPNGQRREGKTGASSSSRWTTFTNESGGFSTDGDGHDGSYGGASTTDDSADDDEEPNGGLLRRDERTSSPFGGRQLGSTGGSPLAARRTAPRPPAPRSRSTTVTKTRGAMVDADGANPFGEDGVSFAQARGELSR